MIVNLYQKKQWLIDTSVDVKKAFISDKPIILQKIAEWFPQERGWLLEIERALQNDTLFIATQDNMLIGFACYDATAKGYFGPFGVAKDSRGKGIGKALFNACMNAMKSAGYGYAIIGWVDDSIDNSPVNFYRKVANASYISDSSPKNTVYSRKIML